MLSEKVRIVNTKIKNALDKVRNAYYNRRTAHFIGRKVNKQEVIFMDFLEERPIPDDSKYSESAKVLQFLRMLGTEEQRIAYAVLEGMRLQRVLTQKSG